MAEEVKIVDVAGGPAAEATLQEILKIMKRGGQSGSGGGGGGAKAQDLYTKAVTRGTTTTKKQTAEVKKSTSALKSFSSGLNSTLGFAFKALGSVLGATTGQLTNFAGAVQNSNSVTEFLSQVPILGSALGKASAYFDKSLQTFQQLSESGAGFGNNMLAMRQASAEAGLSLDQFADMVSSNSSNMTLLGGTVTGGAQRLGKLTKSLRSVENGMFGLGFTQESLNEGMADYIENQARAGQLRGRSDASLTAGAKSYLLEIDKLAKVTGKSRKALQDEINGRMEAANINVLAAQLSGKGLENFQNNLQFSSDIMGKSGPAFSDALGDMADGVSQTPLAQYLEANVSGLKELQVANATGAISQEEYKARLMKMLPEITKLADGMKAAGVTALAQTEGMGEFVQMTADARTAGQREIDMRKAAAEQSKKDSVTDVFAKFRQTIQTIRSNIEEALLKSEVMETLGIALTGISNTLIEVTKGITENVTRYLKSDQFKTDVENFKNKIVAMAVKAQSMVKYLRSEEFKKKFDDFMAKIGEGVKSIKGFVTDVTNLGLNKAIAKALGGAEGQTIGDVVKDKFSEMIGGIDFSGIAVKLGLAITGLFVGAKVIGAMTKGVGSMFGGLFGGTKGGPVKGPAGAGKAGKGVGDFVGNVGGGVLKGIAKGLAAFGNPQVAIGGAVLAGVILVIGAAVAGATWLVGKSLPTFADGMKSFEDLDGAKLSAAGKGMLAVAGGMAAFGAGTAVAGLGNLVGGIADGIGALFGAEKANPLDQLLEFQKYTIDEAKVKGNANALVAYSTAMAAYGGGTAASGLGTLVSGLAGGITSFFGGETGIPYDDIIKFQGYAFDTEKVKANAAAMVAFNEALTSNSSAGAKSGVGNAVGAIGNAIAGFFGAKTPFDKVKDFGAMELNAEGVKTNAEAMVHMANALNSFTSGEAGEIEISKKTVASLERLAGMDSTGIGTLSTNLQSIASITGLDTNINSLNSLDTESITNYNKAMKELVEVLGELNAELAKDNKLGFGSGTNAGDVVAKMDTIGGGGSGTGSSDQLERLNMLVGNLETVMREVSTNTKATATNTSGNIYGQEII